MKKIALITFLVLIIDQLSKIYIKTHFELGEDFRIFDWFHISFVENPGMAYGFSFGGFVGKVILSLLRTVLIIGIGVWLYQASRNNSNNYFIIPMAFIFAGAIGNLLDNVFYGVIFDTGTNFYALENRWLGYNGISKLNFQGYSTYYGGCVVDMLHFPLIDGYFPNWIPYFGGEYFSFFRQVFNVADSVISVGVVFLLLFREKAFPKNSFIN